MTRKRRAVVEFDEPEEGDITTEDHRRWWQHGKLYFVGDEVGLRRKMDKDKFWPNIWFISDHGNAHLITQLGDSCPAPAGLPSCGMSGLGSPPETHQNNAGYWYGSARQFSEDAATALAHGRADCEKAFDRIREAAASLGAADADARGAGGLVRLEHGDSARSTYRKAVHQFRIKCVRKR